MTTKMYSYKRERAKRLYPEPAMNKENSRNGLTMNTSNSGLKNKKPTYTPLRASSLPDRHRQQTFVLLQRFATSLVQGLDLVAS